MGNHDHIQNYQDRVILEKTALDVQISILASTLNQNPPDGKHNPLDISDEERKLLHRQLAAMAEYSLILQKRQELHHYRHGTI